MLSVGLFLQNQSQNCFVEEVKCLYGNCKMTQTTTNSQEIEFLTSDKEVTKQIIQFGDGEKPPKGSAIASTVVQ